MPCHQSVRYFCTRYSRNPPYEFRANSGIDPLYSTPFPPLGDRWQPFYDFQGGWTTVVLSNDTSDTGPNGWFNLREGYGRCHRQMNTKVPTAFLKDLIVNDMWIG